MIDKASTDGEIAQFLNHVKTNAPSDPALATELAEVLVKSGEAFQLNIGPTADIASTGGPSSLTTLLCPLFLRIAGCIVPKLGVPGRPAGGIDCLAQLPSYRTTLASNELRSILDRIGYAHFLAADRFAPLDARVFRLRQRFGAQDIPTLVVASLLSKKLAVGVQRAGLDVRVAPHGNFGHTWSEAQQNSALFAEAAKRHGIGAYPVLTDGRFPYQPYIGRKEALAALWRVFDGTALSWLKEHVELCRTLALVCVPVEARTSVALASAADLQRAFVDNISAQGSSIDEFCRLAEQTLSAHTQTVCALTEGFVNYSLENIRRTLVNIQRAASTFGNEFPDPAGVILLRRSGEWVQFGDAVATVRVENGVTPENIHDLEEAICATSKCPVGLMFDGGVNHG